MNARIRKWMPIALCCLLGIAVAAVVGTGLTLGGAAFGAWLGGPLGLGLIALAMLACPISMGLAMRRQHGTHQNPADVVGNSISLPNCCLPDNDVPADRLAALRARRQALECELAEIQA